MNIIASASPFTFNYPSYDQDAALFVRASIYDVTSGSPSFVSTVNLGNVINGYYSGNYTGQAQKVYLVISLVYTDNTYTVVDTTREPEADIYKSIDAPVTFGAFDFGTYDQNAGLYIGANVYDCTSGTPTFISQVHLAHVLGGVYFGSFTGVSGHCYEIIKLVYLTSSYTTADPNRAPGSDTFQLFPVQISINNYLSKAVLVGQSTSAILVEAT